MIRIKLKLNLNKTGNKNLLNRREAKTQLLVLYILVVILVY